MGTGTRLIGAAFAAGALAIGLPAAGAVAQTQSPALQGYSAPGSEIQSALEPTVTSKPEPEQETEPTPPIRRDLPETPTGSSLPFTGLDLALLGGAGLLLLGMGGWLRLLARRAPQTG